MRDHLKQIHKTPGVPAEILAELPPLEPEVPLGFEYIFEWFWELSSGRGSNGFAAEELKYAEIESWARQILGFKLRPWELRALKAMDSAYLVEAGIQVKENG